MAKMEGVKTEYGTIFTNGRKEMKGLIMAISKLVHLKLKSDIAEMEPKNAMENLQRSLYKN